MRLRIAWATDPGLEREENEDSVVVWRNKAGLDSLLIVCDGMGGHAAGQTASSIAVKTFAAVLAEDGDRGRRHHRPVQRWSGDGGRQRRGDGEAAVEGWRPGQRH